MSLTPRTRAFIVPQVGYRSTVFISDESEDRPSGVARHGGRVTFIPTGRRGQTAVVDLTRIGERVYEAVLVKVLSEVEMPPKAPPAPFAPRPGDPTAGIIAGAELDVVISEAPPRIPKLKASRRFTAWSFCQRRHPDWRARKCTHCRGAASVWPLRNPQQAAGPAPEPVRRTSFNPSPGDPVVPGAIMDVVITEPSGRNPDTEGVARVNGLVVFVQGATTIGERVNVRIVERGGRAAVAEPTGTPPGDVIRRAFIPSADDPAAAVIAGAEMDVVITERSTKNPETEGVAKVNGLVVFVNGATTAASVSTANHRPPRTHGICGTHRQTRRPGAAPRSRPRSQPAPARGGITMAITLTTESNLLQRQAAISRELNLLKRMRVAEWTAAAIFLIIGIFWKPALGIGGVLAFLALGHEARRKEQMVEHADTESIRTLKASFASLLDEKLANDHYILNDLRLIVGREKCWIDHVVVAPSGMFVIHTNHWDGTIIGDTAKRCQWKIRSPDGRVRPARNPISRVLRERRILCNWLKGTQLIWERVFPIVVLASPDADIQVTNAARRVMTPEQAVQFINDFCFEKPVLSNAEVEKLATGLNQHTDKG